MERFGSYFLAQMKRIRRVFPSVFGMALLLTACMALIAMTLQETDAASEKQRKIKIALTGDVSDNYLGFGIIALQRLDSSRFAIDFLEMSEEEAQKKLKEREISAYAVIPDGFVEMLESGEDVHIIYATVNDSSGLGSMIMNELTDTISEMLAQSKSAIYGTIKVMREYHVQEDYGEATDRLYLRFISCLLNRDSLYQMDYFGAVEGLSLIGYYFVAIMILFLLFWGITCSTLFVRRDMSLAKLLRTRGWRTGAQVAAEYLAYLLLMWGNLFLMSLPLGMLFSLTGLRIPEWETEFICEMLLFMAEIFPVVAMLAALQFFLYEMVSDMVSGILLQFLMGVSLGYLSGCILPVSSLPESLHRMAQLLPSGAALQYGLKCLRGETLWVEMGIMVLYLIFFLGLTILVRERRVRV